MLSTNLNYTQSQSYSHIYNKKNYNISDRVNGKELGSDDSKSFIDNYDIGRVSSEITWVEKIPLTNPNYIKNKNHDDICDKNHGNISDKIGNEKLRLNDLKVFRSCTI